MPAHEKKYLIDANVFMDASRRYYQFSFGSPFWHKLESFANEGKIISIDKVFQEIKLGKDELKEWATSSFCYFFDTTKTEKIFNNWKSLMIWADSEQQFTRLAKDEFMDIDNADAWISAYAMANDCIVVTLEAFNSQIKKQIRLPNVCDRFGIDWIDTFDMLNLLRFSF